MCMEHLCMYLLNYAYISGMYSHIDIHTANKGVQVLSEFVPATMVNGTQVDSEINRDWFRGAVDEQFQQNNTQSSPTMHQSKTTKILQWNVLTKQKVRSQIEMKMFTFMFKHY